MYILILSSNCLSWHTSRWQLQFLESEFKGQLPQPYTPGLDGTRVIPKNMNDANLQEKSRFVSLNNQEFLMGSNYMYVGYFYSHK